MKHPNSVDRHVGQRLRALRIARGIEMHVLSGLLGVTQPRLLQMEEGRERISAARLRQLSKILDVRPSEFFAGFSMGDGVQAGAAAADPRDEEKRLLSDFARIGDAKSRALILALVAAYAEYGDAARDVEE